MTTAVDTRICPVCKVASTERHMGDRHLPQCRHYGNNHWPGPLERENRTTPTVTEPLRSAVEEDARHVAQGEPANSRPGGHETAGVLPGVCAECGRPSVKMYCSAACKQKRYRRSHAGNGMGNGA